MNGGGQLFHLRNPFHLAEASGQTGIEQFCFIVAPQAEFQICDSSA